MRVIDRNGHKFQVVDRHYNNWDFWGAFQNGSWEPKLLEEIASLPSQSYLFDIGAWVGPIALWAASHGIRVLAVEPDPVAVEELNQNIEASGLAQLITVVPKALMPEVGKVILNIQNGGGDSQSSTARTNMVDSVEVDTINLAGLLEYGLPDVIKIDIEGGEGSVIPIIGPTLRTLGVSMILSLHWGWVPQGTREALEEELSHWQEVRVIEKETILYGPFG